MGELRIQRKGRGDLAPVDPRQGWVDITLEKALDICDMTREVILETGGSVQKAELFEEENAKELLAQGKVLYTPMLLLRGVIGTKVCPFCGATFEEGMGALSRKDNETVLCSDCGTEEALEEFHAEKK